MRQKRIHIEPGKPLTVKLYTRREGRNRPYYLCMLFRNAEELRIFGREQSKLIKNVPKELTGRRYWRDCNGFARRYRFQKGHGKRNIGCILLCHEHSGVGVVSHEMTHAALYEIKQGDWPITLSVGDDERLAWLQGWLVNQYWRWYWKVSESQKGD